MVRKITIDREGLLVSYDFLKQKGISDNLIYKNVSSGLWIRDDIRSGKNRIKGIRYNSLSFKTKSKLPAFDELMELAQNELDIEALISKQKRHKRTIEYCKAELLNALEDSEKYIPQVVTIYPQLTTEDALIYSQNFAVLKACSRLRDNGLKLKDILFTYHQLRESYPSLKEISKTDATPLRRRIESVLLFDIKGVFDKRLGLNKTPRKFTPDLRLIAEKLYIDSAATIENVKIALDNYCKAKDIGLVSLTTLKDYFRTPEIRNRVYSVKFGSKWHNDHLRPYIPRKKPNYAGSKWVMDGTPLQFIVKDEYGKQLRLEIFAVIDAHSSKFVGYTFTKSETSVAVIQALSIAFERTGYLPGEIVSDNSSAIKSQDTQTLFDRLRRLGVKIRNARVGNAQDKEIEQIFRTFHKYCRTVPGWIGGNITDKSLIYRPSKEHLAEIYAKNGLPNIDTFKALIIQLIDQYNCDDLSGRISPAQAHEASKKPYVIKPNATIQAFLFWPERESEIKKGMIVRKSGSNKYHYRIYDYDDILKLNGRSVIVKYHHEFLDEVHLFDKETGSYICSCRRIFEPNSAQVEQTEEDKINMIKQGVHNQAFQNHILRLKKSNDDKLAEVMSEEDYKLTDVFSIRKEAANKSELSELDKYYDIHGIDPTRINDKVIKPVHSLAPEITKQRKDYSMNPYSHKGDYSKVESDINEEN